MPVHINPNDPNCKNAAAEILRRHDNGEPEANITSAVRDFLTVTGLVKSEHIVEENPPAEGSRRKPWTSPPSIRSSSSSARSAPPAASTPTPRTSTNSTITWPSRKSTAACAWASSPTASTGCCDGPTPDRQRRSPPYAYTLEDPEHWITLYEWLRDNALSAEERKRPSRPTVEETVDPSRSRTIRIWGVRHSRMAV